MIPQILFRVVPERTTDEVEDLWRLAVDLHPDWLHITYRDPIDLAKVPQIAPVAHLATTGAQLAGLVRLAALWNHGGVYIDSDFECFRPFDPLLDLSAFAGWEDANVVPDAVLGASMAHLAIGACLALAMDRIRSNSTDWRTGNGAWSTGPGVTTTVLPGHPDVVLFPPGSFYPYHYSERHRRHDDHRGANPWAFGAHHWHASWLKGG